ncbi:hypothetical protein IAR55_001698 [Kwoniella newhampshirensis]|uniref:Peroxin domain-containing protein n=1 Tax=Kwoniella newhampshirensis TaxID=1651941 RepID=A0AAW0Z354_9TREE
MTSTPAQHVVRPSPNTPTTSRSTAAESDAISSSLAARRRRSLGSIFGDHKSVEHHSDRKGKDKRRPSATGDDQAIGEVVDEDAEERVGEEGELVDDVTTAATIDFEAYTKAIGDPVKLVKGTGTAGPGEEVDLEQVGGDLAPEYVWDVLFENQRGIYFAGTGYFSSKSLLPADPSPFTRPSDHLPSASSFSITHPSGAKHVQPAGHIEGSAQRHLHHRKGKGKGKSHNTPGKGDDKSRMPGRSNKTSYTLETFQPPLPDWEYLTPWMINMRTGTDELGWRYNAWFKKKGWSSHAGPVGWGGWVRRREWVRLRYVVPHSKMKEGDGMVDLKEREHVERKAKRLEDVMHSEKKNENIASVLTSMGRYGVDRQRLEVWTKWLEKGQKDSEAWKRLEELCHDERAVGIEELRLK